MLGPYQLISNIIISTARSVIIIIIIISVIITVVISSIGIVMKKTIRIAIAIIKILHLPVILCSSCSESKEAKNLFLQHVFSNIKQAWGWFFPLGSKSNPWCSYHLQL